MIKFLTLLTAVITLTTGAVFADDRCSASLDSMEQAHGHSFAYMPGIYSLDMEPIQNLARTDPLLSPFKFDFSNGDMMLHALQFSWGHKNDGRAGWALGGGFKRYSSNTVTRPVLDSLGNPVIDINSNALITQDSIVDLMTVLGYGGFLMEKSHAFGPVTVYGGGLVGGGAWVVIRDEQAGSQPSAFHSGMGDSTMPSGVDAAVAPLWVLDLHAGVTYTFSPWIHAGLEGSALMLYAPDGFSVRSETISTLNPGIRLKLVFGSLG
jgi:hypothetical protein